MAKKGEKESKKVVGIAVDLYDEIILLMVLAISILILLSLLGFGAKVGGMVAGFMYGLFGCMALVLPFVIFFGTAFLLSNKASQKAQTKLLASLVLVILFSAFAQLLAGGAIKSFTLTDYYTHSYNTHFGGGLIGGTICMMLCPTLGTISAYVIVIVLIIITLIVITEKSFVKSVKKGSKKLYDTAKEQGEKIETTRKQRAKEREQSKKELENNSEKKVREQTTKESNTKRADKKAKGVISNVELKKEPPKEEIHEITSKYANNVDEFVGVINNPYSESAENITSENTDATSNAKKEKVLKTMDIKSAKKADTISLDKKAELKKAHTNHNNINIEIPDNSVEDIVITNNTADMLEKEYEFPPIDLLFEDKTHKKGNSDAELKETAVKLQQTLRNFGVNVTVTNISCGPSVTRYELQPEQGVKVSKIVSLSDDIKLNLAASDIRIEAPIPGKAAVGIEVPNKENSAVTFRELIDNDEFRNAKSKLTFAVGKDIGGKVVITDIAKMPHLLIAGATGSGKSVCINTLIMSILYKAKPSEVRLIMIDPKVVELSVYNGIPHLLIPVVTDPKKAAGALNWAVVEMTERYKKFAKYTVRDIKGYNDKISKLTDSELENEEEKPEFMPQIVIVVDELADLMMVAPGDVEEAICRLAQLARAAGIHLVIATQRPSVNVITGLIKANVPSRIAFSVSSGIDSRTIIDMVGAEKLLGKGDMLFYPSGYQKPARVQGSYVSDEEVTKVVEFLSAQAVQDNTDKTIESKISEVSMSDSQAFGTDRDIHFEEAGRFIIEKEKASIGMIQRMYKVGFNRAARIMDQLADAGVVGPEEGTKPRKVLMTIEQFEEMLKES